MKPVGDHGAVAQGYRRGQKAGHKGAYVLLKNILGQTADQKDQAQQQQGAHLEFLDPILGVDFSDDHLHHTAAQGDNGCVDGKFGPADAELLCYGHNKKGCEHGGKGESDPAGNDAAEHDDPSVVFFQNNSSSALQRARYLHRLVAIIIPGKGFGAQTDKICRGSKKITAFLLRSNGDRRPGYAIIP